MAVGVEGGARVIRSFLASARAPTERAGTPCVDALVVTVAPALVGAAGVGYGSGLATDAVSAALAPAAVDPSVANMGVRARKLPTFQHARTERFGPDAVFALKAL